MAKTAIEKRLAALETRALQPVLRVEPFPPVQKVEDVDLEGYELITVISGVPLGVAREDITLDGLVGEVPEVNPGSGSEPVTDEDVADEAGTDDAQPEVEPSCAAGVSHSLDPRIRVSPGYTVVQTGISAQPVSLLEWIRG